MNLLTLALTAAISPAQTGPVVKLPAPPRNLTAQFNLVYGSGGTSVDAYLQTSLDDGATWIDIINFHGLVASLKSVANLNGQTAVTTLFSPTDGALGANTCKDGCLGSLFRVKYTSAGTYASTTLTVDMTTDNTRVV